MRKHRGKLHTGSKGGKYRIVHGRKVYKKKDWSDLKTFAPRKRHRR
jgi:hypothetical protein